MTIFCYRDQKLYTQYLLFVHFANNSPVLEHEIRNQPESVVFPKRRTDYSLSRSACECVCVWEFVCVCVCVRGVEVSQCSSARVFVASASLLW